MWPLSVERRTHVVCEGPLCLLKGDALAPSPYSASPSPSADIGGPRDLDASAFGSSSARTLYSRHVHQNNRLYEKICRPGGGKKRDQVAQNIKGKGTTLCSRWSWSDRRLGVCRPCRYNGAPIWCPRDLSVCSKAAPWSQALVCGGRL